VGTDEERYRAAERRMWDSVRVSPTERYLQLARTGTTVRVQEAGEGPPMLLVHGASNSGVSWAELVTRLDAFRWIVLDRPGCGLSPPHPTGFGDIAAFEGFSDALIVDVLDAMELDRAHVVATSFGGNMALRGAAAHPERFHRMVLMGWSVGAPIVRVPLVMRIGAIPVIGRVMAALPANERAVRTIFKSIGLRQALEAGRVSQEMIDTFVALLRHTDTMGNELKAGPRLIRPIAGFDERILLSPELLGRIETPTLFLWGDEDPMGGAAIARPFAAQLPRAELELMGGAGHAVWIDDPDHVAKAVTTFLQA
jgi:pimeloyl-ACP methyl ester carboxylesterase